MADGRERQEWYRVAPIVAALTGISPMRIIPERYRAEVVLPKVTDESNRQGWAVLTRGLMAPPRED